MTEKDRKKNKGSGGLGAVVWIIIMLAGIVVRNGGDSAGPVIAFLIPLAVVVVLVAAMKAAKKKNAAGASPRSADSLRSAPSARTQAPDPTRVIRPAVPLELPEDYGSSDTDRDRMRRRQQLDAFLKNGIIDRKEYRALLERHERRGG